MKDLADRTSTNRNQIEKMTKEKKGFLTPEIKILVLIKQVLLLNY